MAVLMLLAFFAFAILNWFAVAQEPEEKGVEYVAKPATLAALLLFACTGDNPSFWLIAALVLSLLGDIYLMLPGNLFVAGLVAFLLGHLAYVFDFEAAVGWRVVWFAVLVALTFPVTHRIVDSVKEEGLRPAVVFYMLVIMLMAGSAIASASVIGTIGALLFVASDSILAWNRFVQPIPQGRLYTMLAYHLGQLGLVLALRGG